MTGFGATEKEGVRVEIRSVNHRFMDISVRLSPLLNEHEMPLRNMLKGKFSRGKFDVLISITGDARIKFKLNTGLAREIYKSLNALKSELSIPGTIGFETLLNYRELLVEGEPEYDISSLYGAFSEAMAQLEKMRLDEGKALAEEILGRANRLDSMNRELIALSPEIIADYSTRFHERLKELLAGMEYDRDRVLQEIALMLEKTDITEELARIENHLKQFRKILADDDTIGKRLDFLLQELNREVNTIASKADDLRISNMAIEMKSEIEKIREQVQNIQ
ncbi:MAG: YicC family protein [Nitrospirae bacterium]|nr:YicC family protein [Nitrospirota bacterium]